MSSERQIRAQFVQVGTHLLTPDGWQQIRGVLAFQEDDKSLDQVTVYTDEKTLDDSNGWEYRFNDLVRTRGEVPAESGCPVWCVEHYRGGERLEQTNHASFPESVNVVEVCTGEPHEMGLWLERRDDRETGETEVVGLLEIARIQEDVELPPEGLRLLARKLTELADLAERG